jgi:class 3 adenylate cyclase
VAIPYGVGAWLLVQVAEVVLDAFEAPAWIMQGLLVVLLLGFPVAVILAWIFDITPEHTLVRTGRVDAAQEAADGEEQADEAAPVPSLSVEMGASERRQVTILNAEFERLQGDDPEFELESDPELWREAVAGRKEMCRELAGRFEAHALPAGADELMLVFGYPQAREDDARRAVSAGLALINEIRNQAKDGSSSDHGRFVVRVGISTGLVVIDEPADDEGDVTIIGQAPRMAAWLRGLADADAAVIGPHTRKLVTRHFELEPAGTHHQAQFGGKLDVFVVKTALSLDGTLTRATPLLGREDEMHLLRDRWDNAVEGGGQFVILRGEPGIGKSSLMGSFIQHVIQSGEVTFLPCRCSPQDRNNPLTPIIQVLQDTVLEISERDSPAKRWEKLAAFTQNQPVDPEQALPLLAHLLSLEDCPEYTPPAGSAQIVRMQTMELLLDLISLAAERKPLLFVVEDLHWADPSTQEMIRMLVDRGPAPGLFVLFSCRPVFTEDWTKRSYVLVLELLPLAHRSARELIRDTAAGIELPPALIDRIIAETDGNPLFIQELTLAVLESEDWQKSAAPGSHTDLSRLKIPATLQDSLAARVDNLGEAKSLLQLCSVLGQTFSYDLLRAVSATENEAALKRELSEIVGAELLYQRGVLRNLTYSFKHILIQETAYSSLLKSKRRELHGRTAAILEQEIKDVKQRQPALLAFHYSEAGNAPQAIPLWTLASRQSLADFANQEAAEQARRGIELLEAIPEPAQRAAAEVPLQSVLGTALLSLHGYVDPQVRRVFTRAQDLCEQIGDVPQLFQVVVGLWMYYIISARLDEAYDLSQQLSRIAETTRNPAQFLQARYCEAFVLYYRAEYAGSKAALEAALESETDDYDYAAQSASGDDTRIHVRVLLALVNWHLGFSRTASRLVKEANSIARRAEHPWGMTFAEFYSAWFEQMRGDAAATLSHASEAARIAEENGFRFWMPLSGFMKAWAASHQQTAGNASPDAEAANRMKAGLDLYRGVGAGAGLTYLSFKLAEEFISLNRIEAAEEELDSGLNAMRSNGETFFEPEYSRLRGRIHLQRYRQDNDSSELDQAVSLFEAAVDAARLSGSRGLELRATLDYSEVLSLTDRGREATRLINQILAQFDETDDSADFKTASQLLSSTSDTGGQQ